MSHIHVCLVSDQTIPNILSIFHFAPDELLFVTTETMEAKGMTDNILNSLSLIGRDYKGRYNKIVVIEDSLHDCGEKLKKWSEGKDEYEFTINITGGTKIMSIAAYEHFKEFGSRIGYVPLGKNEFVTVFPKKSIRISEQISLRLNVDVYLAAYGVKIENANSLKQHTTEAELSQWIVENYSEIKELLTRLNEKLRNYRNEKKGYLLTTSYEPANEKEKELFNRLNFHINGKERSKQFSKSEINYITGGWLEEYCYTELLQFKNKGIDDIVLGAVVKKGKIKNEFDLLFTSDNALYTVECKSLDQGHDKKGEALYKIGALQKDFGLRVGSFFVSTSPYIMREGELHPTIKERAERYNTTVVPPDKVINFAEIAAGKLKIK